MKKWLVLLLAFALAVFCSACGPKQDEAAKEETTAEEAGSATVVDDDEIYVALVTDVGYIDDQSFNQACWQAVEQFAEEFELDYAYYRPANQTPEAVTAAIDTAASEGVDIMLCPGSLFEPIVYEMQYKYPDISFLLIDGEPHPAESAEENAAEGVEGDSEKSDAKDSSEEDTAAEESAAEEIADNVHCIVYQEEQAGFLAGYAAVTEGLTSLGFVGGMELPAVTRYGYGFIQGADQAARKTNVQVEINYWYSGSFDPSDKVYDTCSEWYTGGTKAIFACGGKLFKSVIQAAEEADGRYVIGVDVDQAPLSKTIITSAMKELQSTTYDALCQLEQNQWSWPTGYAGATAHLGAADQATGLPTGDASWRFKKFTKENYEELLNGVIDGSIKVSGSIDLRPETTNVTIHYVK